MSFRRKETFSSQPLGFAFQHLMGFEFLQWWATIPCAQSEGCDAEEHSEGLYSILRGHHSCTLAWGFYPCCVSSPSIDCCYLSLTGGMAVGFCCSGPSLALCTRPWVWTSLVFLPLLPLAVKVCPISVVNLGQKFLDLSYVLTDHCYLILEQEPWDWMLFFSSPKHRERFFFYFSLKHNRIFSVP